jgi:hypothetical protein
MKTCPECGTQYEDHVSTCLVDGADLSSVKAASAPPISAPPPETAYRVVAIPPPAAPPSGALRGGLVLLVAALMAGGALLAIVVALIVLLRPVEPTRPPPAPKPPPVAAPVPVPVAPVPVEVPVATAPTIELISDPAGAEIWEGNIRLCVAPCRTDHPDHAPLPRVFTFKLAGFIDTTYEMSDPAGPHQVRMKRPVPTTKPQPGPKLPKLNDKR